METQLEGRNLILYGLKNGTLMPICGSVSCSISISAEEEIATPPPDSVWKWVYYGQLSYTISNSGMCYINPDKFTHRDIEKAIMNREYLVWSCRSLDNTQDYLSGTVMITSYQKNGDMGDAETFSFNGTGRGGILNENPYELKLLQTRIVNGDTRVLGSDQTTFLGEYITGGLPPITD